MKKALSVFLMAAMAFGAFADEPVADVKVAEFSGNAAVTWGVDLDSGTTGFQNSTDVTLKLNLLNGGSKSTTGDGVWGELVIKTDGDTFVGWNNTTKDDSANKGMKGALNLGVKVDTAKIHFGPAYVGITSGDTQTGELKLDAAIRSADKDGQSKWLDNVGPDKYTQGIVAGYDSDMFKVDLDLRSKPATSTKMVPEMGFVTKVEDKDSDGNVTEGDILTFNNGKTHTVTAEDVDLVGAPISEVVNKPGVMPFPVDDATYYYTDNYAAALEGEFKGVENLSVKAGVSYNFAKNYQPNKASKDKTAITPQHTLGYSASAGYKLALDDTFFVRPQVGFAGATTFVDNDTSKITVSGANLAFGVLFGWGDISQDKNAGVYYLDDNMAKKVTPGISVVASVPLATTTKTEPKDGDTTTITGYGKVAARIMPSFYSGEIVPGLTAAAYADIVVPKTGEDDDKTTYELKKAVTAMAFTLGAKYALNVEEMTITPQIGLRFANAAYVDYGITEKGNAVFAKMGGQKKNATPDENGIISDGNYMNLKLGVDVAGLIDNTTLSVNWATDNILNAESTDTTNINKLGTLNFKAKIAL